jgi:hypothetical protein
MKNRHHKLIITCCLLILLPVSGMKAGGNLAGLIKPFRVLIVIGDQWGDPMGYMVERPGSAVGYPGMEESPGAPAEHPADFHHLCVMLKSWGIPFDIVRLDQQFLDRYMFLDMYDKPKYGTIIWSVNQTDRLLHPDYSIVTEMVQDYGIGLIALSDRITRPELQSLLGLQYIGNTKGTVPITVKQGHFLSGGLASPFVFESGSDMQLQQVSLSGGTAVILEQGNWPQATARRSSSGGYTVWIGGDHNSMFHSQGMRTLLRRAITWTVGYNLYKTWENDIVMIMDDPGMAANAYLKTWQFPVLSEEIIEKYLIQTLLEHNAVLNINFTPGFVNDSKRRLEPTWKQRFTDEFGVEQDYVSSKRGYDKGVKLGVFGVMCHGLTHMQPDLVSEPGWFGSSIEGEKAEVGWYQEFRDNRRQKEIPAAEQLWRMTTGKTWIEEQFGITPLQICPGGSAFSHSYFNNSMKLAARAGFGWFGWRNGYLGKDLVINGWQFFGTSESPEFVGSPPDAHDFGISVNPSAFATIFGKYPRGRFISINEFIGYLHAGNAGMWDPSNNRLVLTVGYDPHYCRHFETHPSFWNLEFSDWLTDKSGKTPVIRVNGKPVIAEGLKIEIPEGTGLHEINVEF